MAQDTPVPGNRSSGLTRASTMPAAESEDFVAAVACGTEGGLYAEAMADFERQFLLGALHTSGRNVPLAAKQLGLGRSTLYKKLARLGIVLANEISSRGRDKA